MTDRLKAVVREAYSEIFNPFVGLLERIVAIWFLIAIFMGFPVAVLGWITQDVDLLELAVVNLLLGCPYVIKKVWIDKK